MKCGRYRGPSHNSTSHFLFITELLRPGLTIVIITRNRLFMIRKNTVHTEKTIVRENLREFKWNHLRWVHKTMTMDKNSQLKINTILLVNRILATVIISFLPCFSIWQFSVVCISCKTHSRTIYYVFRPMSVWLVIARG